MDINQFQKNIGYFFKNSQLLKTAFTHTSYANEHGIESYERLEFLGDAIVDFLVGEYLFNNFPNINEGLMTRIRAALVCEKTLSELATEIGIGECMLLGNGAELCGDRARPSILADMFEAHIAAMYLDAGIDNTREYLRSLYKGRIEKAACSIVYEIISSDGPIHHCLFEMQVVANGKILGKGRAYSKKEAQQRAAEDALNKLV